MPTETTNALASPSTFGVLDPLTEVRDLITAVASRGTRRDYARLGSTNLAMMLDLAGDRLAESNEDDEIALILAAGDHDETDRISQRRALAAALVVRVAFLRAVYLRQGALTGADLDRPAGWRRALLLALAARRAADDARARLLAALTLALRPALADVAPPRLEFLARVLPDRAPPVLRVVI